MLYPSAHLILLFELAEEELAAGLNAAVLICGGPGMSYSALALDLFDQYSAE